ncbi:MAG: hypothetical protein IPJ06_00720 [Saprospiraceae bacterium]|nr:hypothetical protein [Saprospiraceae bacterium]
MSDTQLWVIQIKFQAGIRFLYQEVGQLVFRQTMSIQKGAVALPAAKSGIQVVLSQSVRTVHPFDQPTGRGGEGLGQGIIIHDGK